MPPAGRVPVALRTARLVLRTWRDEDLEPFAAMCADAAVMEHFPSRLTREESDATAGRIRAHFDERGFGYWAVEVPGAAPFIGFVGIADPRMTTTFTPCIEIGWRLAREHWGKGYATEAAREALRFGFEDLDLTEIVSFTVPANVRSRRVMETIGMARDEHGDFLHPRLPEGHPLGLHVLYRLSRAWWTTGRDV